MPMQRYLFIRRSSGGAQERPAPVQLAVAREMPGWTQGSSIEIREIAGQ
jgi:hypothetical protein